MKPYYSDEYVTLFHGDCLEIAPQLAARPGMFGFVDPIYNVGKDYGTCKDRMTEPEYLTFTADWLSQMRRLCPQTCVYAPNKWLLHYWTMLGPEYRQILLTWTAAQALRAGWLEQYAILLTNAKPQRQGVPSWWPNTQRAGLGFLCKEVTYEHPGYTSEDITNRVLADLAPEGSVLVDFFAGTGTTLFCAKMRGLQSIGIEIDERWCEVIAQRCSQGVLGDIVAWRSPTGPRRPVQDELAGLVA